MRLPVSRPACKELRGRHSILTTSKKLNKWKINDSSQNCQRSEVTGQTAAPKLEKQLQRITTYRKQKPPREPVMAQENLNCNWQIAGGSVWTNLRLKNSRGPSDRGPHTFVSFTSRSSTRSSQCILEKNPFMLLAEEGEKEPFWKTPQNSVLHKAWPWEKLFTTAYPCWSFIRA